MKALLKESTYLDNANFWFEQLLLVAKTLQHDFVIDQYNRNTIDQLSKFFAKDTSFKGDLKKGIALVGPVGSGKTLIMKVFVALLQSFYEAEIKDAKECFRFPDVSFIPAKIISTNFIVENFCTDGMQSIQRFISGPHAAMICFDDLGSEPGKSNYMGNAISVMSTIISRRYERGKPFQNFCFTSNFGLSQLGAYYDPRIESRLIEMVNFIELLGNDRRK
jgi:DNA replication protein DnaC